MGATALLVVIKHVAFLFDAQSPHWKHIAPFEWFLLPHAVAGIVALMAGPLQFSTRIRASRLALHRLIGRIYIGAVAIAAPIGLYIGVAFEPSPLREEQVAQGGFWFLCTLVAFLAIRKRNIALHRAWMVRSYAFTFIFVSSRLGAVPGLQVVNKLDVTQLTNMLWYLIVAAFLLPDLYNAAVALYGARASSKDRSGA